MPLVQRQADSGKITVSASEPATPLKGDLWYDTGDNELFSYNGSAFVSTGHAASETQTLTNKTLALGSNTISGTTAQFNTANTNGTFAEIAAAQTLTNKTIGTSQLSNTLGVGTLAKMELLDTHQATGTESTYTYTPDPALDLDAKYEEIIVIAKGKTTASLAILLKINAATEYHTTLTSNIVGTISGIHNGSAANVELISNSILNSGRGFNSNIHISKEIVDSSISLTYYGFANASTRALQTFAGGSVATAATTITSIQIFTSTSTWIAGTTINTYGVLQ